MLIRRISLRISSTLWQCWIPFILKRPSESIVTLSFLFFFVSPWQNSCQEVGLLSLRLSTYQGASLGDFLLAPACPIEKVAVWVGFLYSPSGFTHSLHKAQGKPSNHTAGCHYPSNHTTVCHYPWAGFIPRVIMLFVHCEICRYHSETICKLLTREAGEGVAINLYWPLLHI